MSAKIVFVQTLHDQDDETVLLRIEPGIQGVAKPLIDRPPLRFRERFFRLDRIVDDDHVRAAPGQNTSDRSGEAVAVRFGLELLHRLLLAPPSGLEYPCLPTLD